MADASALSTEELLAIAGLSGAGGASAAPSSAASSLSNDELLAIAGLPKQESLLGDSGMGNFAEGVLRSAPVFAGGIGDLMAQNPIYGTPYRLGYQALFGEEMPAASAIAEKGLSGVGLPREESIMQRVGEYAIPFAPEGKLAQVVSGVTAGLAQGLTEKYAPKNPTAQMGAGLLGALAGGGLFSAGRSQIGKLFPQIGAQELAKDIAGKIRGIVPGALTEAVTPAERTLSVAKNLETLAQAEKAIAGAKLEALPKETVYLDDAISAVRSMAEKVGGPITPGSRTEKIIGFLENLKPKDRTITTAPGLILDEAGKPLIAGGTEVIPGGPATLPLPEVQNALRDIRTIGEGASGVDKLVLGKTQRELIKAVSESVEPETFKAFKDARAAWRSYARDFEEGAVKKVRDSAIDSDTRLNTFGEKLLNDPKSTKQLVSVMSPEDLANARSLALHRAFKGAPVSWQNTIRNKYDSFKILFGEENADKLLKMVSREGTVGQRLLQDNNRLSGLLAKMGARLGVKAAAGFLLGPQVGVPATMAAGMLSGLDLIAMRAEGKIISRAPSIIMNAAIGNKEAIKILSQPTSKVGYATAMQALETALIGPKEKKKNEQKPAPPVPFPVDETPAPEDVAFNALSQGVSPMSMEYTVDMPTLVKAVIGQESGGNPGAVSPVGAQGLMQLMPATGEELFRNSGLQGKYNPLDPEQNQLLGTMYLKQMLQRFGGDPELALTAYHSGPERVERLLAAKKGKTLADILSGLGPAGRKYARQVLERYAALLNI